MPLRRHPEFSAAAPPWPDSAEAGGDHRLRVVARTADGKTHVAWREIKVTLGGCGA